MKKLASWLIARVLLRAHVAQETANELGADGLLMINDLLPETVEVAEQVMNRL